MKNTIINKGIAFLTVVFSLALVNNAFADSGYELQVICPTCGEYVGEHKDNSYDLYPQFQPYNYNYNNQPYNYNNQPYYNQAYNAPTTNTVAKTDTNPAVVNNYYYQYPTTSSSTTNKTSTVSKTDTTTKAKVSESSTNTNNDSTNKNTSSNLGASAYNSTKSGGVTALTLRGSGGFMPSSIWQWMLVVVLILTIIILSRIAMRRHVVPATAELHPAHTH